MSPSVGANQEINATSEDVVSAANGGIIKSRVASGGKEKQPLEADTQNKSPLSEDGFPFEAANGTAGESPTVFLFKGREEPIAPRRSVQFARTSTSPDVFGPSQPSYLSTDGQTGESTSGEGTASKLLSRIRSFASPTTTSTPSRTASGLNIGDSTVSPDDSSPQTPPQRRRPKQLNVQSANRDLNKGGQVDEEDADDDADAEESPTEGDGTASRSFRRRVKRVRHINRPTPNTAPTTPRSDFFAQNTAASTPTAQAAFRGGIPPVRRSATSNDVTDTNRQGLSEDEGRDRLAKTGGWRKRGAALVQGYRGDSYLAERSRNHQSFFDRPVNLRRLTTSANTAAAGGVTESSPSAWRRGAARTTTISGERWKKLKRSMKMLSRKDEKPTTIDHEKSAELVAELLAGSPAAVILASMFQRDEREKKKIPVLLEQLKINITNSQRREDASGDRHLVFTIALEYGSGLTRMKWVIERSLRDFANLHLKYKLLGSSHRHGGPRADDPKSKLPRFPRSALPYMRGVRGLFDDDEEEEDEAAGTDDGSGNEGPGPGGRPVKHKRRPSSINPLRRRSDAGEVDPEVPAQGTDAARSRELYIEKQRRKLEQYLQQMIRFLIFRPGSNRLCRFLELSALGIRLAAEGGYHGKEGFLVLESGKGIDFRRGWTPRLIIARHSPMWFLVRQSYVVCVDSPEEMNVYDVFLVDPDFTIAAGRARLRDQKSTKDFAKTAKHSAAHPQNHLLRLGNSERRLKLLAKNDRQLIQFEKSIRLMQQTTDWGKQHRFDSFAPVRTGVFAQWLVDGRDYMWNVSRAISMARDVIYIHDWWLSPELYMRRPAAISQKWRLDRLLQRKAQEGVKVFVIMYRNINSAVPIDSEYSKFSLLDLHPNIFVQRSPNQVRQNVFFWAHHEKICVVDHTVAFCGGVDLCFGRWDTPQHSLIDDKLTGFEDSSLPKDADHCQLWPGKDYSNPRVLDFFKLDKPYEEMYDRAKVPRMPWHDIGMQIVGQPARDLTRHFVQRWNYILRQRKPSRPTPFLLPPPDFLPADLEALGLQGTCEIQILRSACEWSIGTPDKVEHSIMNAYVKMIETSTHFVYIENQFFITSCEMEGSRIHNLIGDALVERITRAHERDEEWLAIIVIPLMPGFQNTVDSQDGTSVRLIMQCQFRSICRGSTSIFERLRAVGINPEDYIQFYSLRSWGKIGPTKALVTEQLYIHAKVMIVDDRTAIIGSANINERSMLGNRDSEIAAIVRDTDMIDSVMAGHSFRVGRFPHTLRMRLMREHLGIDVDELAEVEREEELMQDDMFGDHGGERVRRRTSRSSRSSSLESDRTTRLLLIENRRHAQDELIAKAEELHSFNHDFDLNNPHLQSGKRLTTDPRVTNNAAHERDVRGEGTDNMLAIEKSPVGSRGRDSVILGEREVLVNGIAPEGRRPLTSSGSSQTANPISPNPNGKDEGHPNKDHRPSVGGSAIGFAPLPPLPPASMTRMHTADLGLTLLSQLPPLPATDDADIGLPNLRRTHSRCSVETSLPALANMRRPIVEQDSMIDPLNSSFFAETWHRVAENNTRLFRQVFRCMPDNQVTTWRDYEAYTQYAERFAHAQGMPQGPPNSAKAQEDAGIKGAVGIGGPPGHGSQLHAPTLNSLAAAAKDAGTNDTSTGTATDEKGTGINEKGATVNEKSDGKPVLSEGYGMPENSVNEKNGGGSPGRNSAETRDEMESLKRIDIENGVDATTEITKSQAEAHGHGSVSHAPAPAPASAPAAPASAPIDSRSGSQRRTRRRGNTKSSGGHLRLSDPIMEKGDAEELCKLIQGTLVVWPTEWLSQEERGGKWLYSVDQMAPLEIYD